MEKEGEAHLDCVDARENDLSEAWIAEERLPQSRFSGDHFVFELLVNRKVANELQNQRDIRLRRIPNFHRVG